MSVLCVAAYKITTHGLHDTFLLQVGGFSSRELIRLLRSMKGLNIVSGDVVEVAPAYDHAGKRDRTTTVVLQVQHIPPHLCYDQYYPCEILMSMFCFFSRLGSVLSDITAQLGANIVFEILSLMAVARQSNKAATA